MKNLTAFFVAVLLGVGALAQQPKPDISKRAAPANSMQISQYMREAGLTYLEVLDKAFDQASQDYWAYRKAEREGSDSLLDMPKGSYITDNFYGKELTRMEDHMEINVKSETDKKFLKFLEYTKYLAKFPYFELSRQREPAYKDLPPTPNLVKLYIACDAVAYVIAKSGVFNDRTCAYRDIYAAYLLDDPKVAADMEKSFARYHPEMLKDAKQKQ